MTDGWQGYAALDDWVSPDKREGFHDRPVWVTPLVEGEPKPGEMWAWKLGNVTILTVPVTELGDRVVLVKWGSSVIHAKLSELTPIPEKKRYGITFKTKRHDLTHYVTFYATDRDDLRKQLNALADDAEVVE